MVGAVSVSETQGICQVVRIIARGILHDVVRSRTGSASLPMPFLHLTVLMNYCTNPTDLDMIGHRRVIRCGILCISPVIQSRSSLIQKNIYTINSLNFLCLRRRLQRHIDV